MYHTIPSDHIAGAGGVSGCGVKAGDFLFHFAPQAGRFVCVG